MASPPANDRQIQSQPAQPRRGLFLRFMYRVYTNYLGVTPPKPEHEKTVAFVLIGGIFVFLIAVVLFVRFVWFALSSAGSSR